MSLSSFLNRSRALPAFREAAVEFVRTGRASERIAFSGGLPPVKVERAITKLLESSPELELESVEIRGSSGCEYFRGELSARTPEGEHTVSFYWDCKWKAQQQGWSDYFGFPDQARAAREFGHDCFREWSEVITETMPMAT